MGSPYESDRFQWEKDAARLYHRGIALGFGERRGTDNLERALIFVQRQLPGVVLDKATTVSGRILSGGKPMQRARSFQFVLLFSSLAVALPSAMGQVTFATLQAGNSPFAVAANSTTNKAYVANNSDATVTVIDGVTNNTTTVTVGFYPDAIAMNPVTNQIYVANLCGSDPNCFSPGTVTVIDGATLNTTSVAVGNTPVAVAVNSATNQIYVANYSDNTVTVIDANNMN